MVWRPCSTGWDYLHRNKKKVPVTKSQITRSFGARGPQSRREMVSINNDVRLVGLTNHNESCTQYIDTSTCFDWTKQSRLEGISMSVILNYLSSLPMIFLRCHNRKRNSPRIITSTQFDVLGTVCIVICQTDTVYIIIYGDMMSFVTMSHRLCGF
jgi:hypothetical protein